MATEKRLIDANVLCEFFQERYEYLRNASETPLPGGRVLVNTEIQCGAIIAKEFLDKAKEAPTVDAVVVEHDENCVICNSELDEKYAGGIWDLALEIVSLICPESDHDEQGTVYNAIRGYLERQNYCPNCGAKMDGGNEDG